MTTVRFDADLWERLCEIADRLGIARAALIRDATREHISRIEHTDRLTQLEDQVRGLMSTVATLAKRLRELFGERRS
ncbi:MAG TPA: CopG family transcriptional regulator [Conexibacter sp.]